MKNLLIKSTVILLATVSFVACQKEKQETFSEVQTSSINQGNGVMETMHKGPGGTVVFSNWITKTEPDWTGFGTQEIKTDINTTSLTDAVRDNGLVLVYFELGNQILLLPQVRLEYNQVINFSFSTGKITLSVWVEAGAAITGIADLRFRYVLIPANAFNGPGGRMSNPVDYNDYNAVCEYYGISK